MDILELISQKLEMFKIELTDPQVQMMLGEVDQSILNYCQIEEMPAELLYVRANLVIDYARHLEQVKPAEEGAVIDESKLAGRLTSISVGDVSYNFAQKTSDKGDLSNAHIVDLDGLLFDYRSQLNNFRRVVW